tara:strand:+ start:2817 stop:3302 length:486 start_codon:yes stop_codon:yes gene_type:complete
MKKEHQIYINENRLKESMLTMASSMGIPYNRVRNYMIKKGLQLEIKTKKKKTASIISGGSFYNNLNCNDLGCVQELIVSVDLLTKGYNVYRAHSPSAPFDIMAYKEDGNVQYNIEVRTGMKTVNGSLYWGKTKHENHFDIYAIVFGPDIYYYNKEKELIII